MKLHVMYLQQLLLSYHMLEAHRLGEVNCLVCCCCGSGARLQPIRSRACKVRRRTCYDVGG
jgi:hypothetical protein